ncbi:glycoside hydrolase family 2 protein, partial [Devosia sp.]|uniref:glycoside hydrolase family 2 protein n=1 Tax=Devosia sp. TaxID=1871048 RepID=UPI0037BF96BA
QGLAIKTAIEYWRSTKPRCMGTLFWQINDTYPVASWASLDYGGQWKLLQYMAKRFFLPINVVAYPEADTVLFKAINDSGSKAEISLEIRAVDVGGADRVVHSDKITVSPDGAVVVFKLPAKKLGAGEFLFFSWHDADGRLLGENDFFPKAYKAYDPAMAKVTARWTGDDKAPVLVLSTDKPAFFVTATVDVPGYFSDNAITLLPGRETTLTFTPRLGAKVTQKALAKSLKVRHLRETY